MKKGRIRVFLVDDHAIVRYGIRSLIERNEGMEVCGEADRLQEAYYKIADLKPDIILLDIKLPDGDGASGCREIKRWYPDAKVIILTAFAEDSIILEAIKAGAEGYLLKNIESKNIIMAIQDVAAGKSALGGEITTKVLNAIKMDQVSQDDLTVQEKNILELISRGKTNKDIGEALYISEKTVRNNVSKILKKNKC